MSSSAARALPALVFLWAGICISGNLVAAPAKFTVEGLDLPLALQVGRAQFAWIGALELAALAALALICLTTRRLPAALALAALLFAVQQLGLQPMLEARSDAIIAGGPYTPSRLHLAFVALEGTKVALLLWTGWGAMAHR
ncbi:MAG: hypothetical protein AAGF60_02945 [Pseudomonadota bacterium]